MIVCIVMKIAMITDYISYHIFDYNILIIKLDYQEIINTKNISLYFFF